MLAVLTASISVASAQEAGQWALGPRMGIYTNSGEGAILGLGVYARYNLTDAWRLEPAVTVLFHSNCSVDINLDAHYLFEVARGWYLYPVLGVTVSDMVDEWGWESQWAFGMNVGAGVDFRVARHWDLTAGVKWMPVFDADRRNPIVINLGAAYRF